MKGGGFLDGLYTLLFIIAIVGSMVLGGWLALKYFTPSPASAPASAPVTPKPHHHPDHYDPGSTTGGGFSPDPWTPNYDPDDIPVPPPPAPAPPDRFKPVLNLTKAVYNPVSRYLNVGYKVLPSGAVPPSKSFTINYDILVDGKPLTDTPEEEPLSAAEMSGLQQSSLVPVTGADPGIKPSQMLLSAQIHFRENGTSNMGTIGSPVTIPVQ